jgi:hypothetical protein
MQGKFLMDLQLGKCRSGFSIRCRAGYRWQDTKTDAEPDSRSDAE